MEKVKLCKLTLAGYACYYSGSDKRVLQGYMNSPSAIWEEHGNEIEIGAPLIDNRAVLEENPSLSFRAPMLDVDRSSPEKSLFEYAFTYVDVETYVDYWRQNGATIYRYNGSSFEKE